MNVQAAARHGAQLPLLAAESCVFFFKPLLKRAQLQAPWRVGAAAIQ